jgi:hypothetical protein
MGDVPIATSPVCPSVRNPLSAFPQISEPLNEVTLLTGPPGASFYIPENIIPKAFKLPESESYDTASPGDVLPPVVQAPAQVQDKHRFAAPDDDLVNDGREQGIGLVYSGYLRNSILPPDDANLPRNDANLPRSDPNLPRNDANVPRNKVQNRVIAIEHLRGKKTDVVEGAKKNNGAGNQVTNHTNLDTPTEKDANQGINHTNTMAEMEGTNQKANHTNTMALDHGVSASEHTNHTKTMAIMEDTILVTTNHTNLNPPRDHSESTMALDNSTMVANEPLTNHSGSNMATMQDITVSREPRTNNQARHETVNDVVSQSVSKSESESAKNEVPQHVQEADHVKTHASGTQNCDENSGNDVTKEDTYADKSKDTGEDNQEADCTFSKDAAKEEANTNENKDAGKENLGANQGEATSLLEQIEIALRRIQKNVDGFNESLLTGKQRLSRDVSRSPVPEITGQNQPGSGDEASLLQEDAKVPNSDLLPPASDSDSGTMSVKTEKTAKNEEDRTELSVEDRVTVVTDRITDVTDTVTDVTESAMTEPLETTRLSEEASDRCEIDGQTQAQIGAKENGTDVAAFTPARTIMGRSPGGRSIEIDGVSVCVCVSAGRSPGGRPIETHGMSVCVCICIYIYIYGLGSPGGRPIEIEGTYIYIYIYIYIYNQKA